MKVDLTNTLTLEQYLELEPRLTRPITDPFMRRRNRKDEVYSRLVQPRWRPPRPQPATIIEENAA